MSSLKRTVLEKSTLPWGLLLLLTLAACDSAADVVTNATSPGVSDAGEQPAGALSESTRLPESKYEDYRIVTLLPRDAIPAIDNPEFVPAGEADQAYDPEELVIGVEFNGDARAYSVPFLSRHEIVNDTVGDVKIAVTW